MADHWNAIFQDKPINTGDLDIFRGLLPRLPDGVRWERTLLELEELLQHFNK